MKFARSDIVVLDAVVCCYPDVASLVDNSILVAGRYYAFSVPDNRRFVTKVLRLLLPIQGLIYRRSSFHFFIHSTRGIRQTLEHKGLRQISESSAGWI